MPSKIRHLHQDSRGRYHARMGVPKDLRDIIGKRELIKALGGDRQRAQRALPAVIAAFHETLDAARYKTQNVALNERPLAMSAPLTIEQIGAKHFEEKLKLDDELRDANPGYSQLGLDDGYVADVRSIYAGSAHNELIDEIFGNELRHYSKRGFHAHAPGSSDWRRLAARLALSELEFLKRMVERDAGQFVSDAPDWVKAHSPKIQTAEKSQESQMENKHTLLELFQMCRRAKTGNQELTDRTSKAYIKPIKDFIIFTGTSDPSQIKNRTISKWIEHLQFEIGLDPKTIKSRYLPAVKHTLRWAGNQGHIEPVMLTASVSVSKKRLDRDKGYTEGEAAAVLAHAMNYQRSEKSRESLQLSAAKRWTPWLVYFTGARIGEIVQLRKQDVRTENSISYTHITPEAGTTKTGLWRDVPLHSQLIEHGFLDFVKEAANGPLFFPKGKPDQDLVEAAGTIAQRIAKWIKDAGLVPEGVAPNHGFRHTFKTLARRYDIPTEYMHAIQGHATEAAGQDYGDVDLATMKREIEKLPKVILVDHASQ